MSYQAFVKTTFLSLALLAIFVAGINYLIDPYAMMGTKRITGLNAVKPAINNYVRTSKRYQPFQSNWNAVILGNSRVEMGLNPSHSCFERLGLQVYNLGLPGAGVHSQLSHGANLIYQQPITTIYLSLDFVDFLVREGSQSPTSLPTEGYGLERLLNGNNNSEYSQSFWSDHYRALFSLDALRDSAKTLTMQLPDVATRDSNGFNPARDFAKATHLEGPGALFAQKMASIERRYTTPWSLRDANGETSTAFLALDEFLQIAKEKQIKLTVLLNPFHQQFWQLMQRQQLMAQHREWKQLLVQTLGASQIHELQLWDFSEHSAYITEAVPAVGERAPALQWFWEPAHYRTELGDLMIEAMMAETCDTNTQFGRRLL